MFLSACKIAFIITVCHPLELLKSVIVSQPAQCKELEDTLRVKEKEIARICEEKARLAKDLEMVYGKNLEMDEEITIYRMLLVEWEGTARCV